MQIGQNGCREHIDPPQQVVLRIIRRALTLKTVAADLGPAVPSSPTLLPRIKQEIIVRFGFSTPFFDSIDPNRNWRRKFYVGTVALPQDEDCARPITGDEMPEPE